MSYFAWLKTIVSALLRAWRVRVESNWANEQFARRFSRLVQLSEPFLQIHHRERLEKLLFSLRDTEDNLARGELLPKLNCFERIKNKSDRLRYRDHEQGNMPFQNI